MKIFVSDVFQGNMCDGQYDRLHLLCEYSTGGAGAGAWRGGERVSLKRVELSSGARLLSADQTCRQWILSIVQSYLTYDHITKQSSV